MKINIVERAQNPKCIAKGLLLIILVATLSVMSQHNYFIFHCLVEGFTILVAGSIYVLATKTYKYSGNDYLFFIGTAYFFIAIVDFAHMLVYSGVLFGNCPDLPTEFWIFARYMEAITILVAPYFVVHKIKPLWVPCLVYSILAGFGIIMVLSGLLPRCYVSGQGLTAFKVASEYIICALLLGGIIHLIKRRDKMNALLFKIMVSSAAITIASELSFTLYHDVYGIMNVVGHLLKVVSFALVYWGIVLRGLEYPFDLVFEKMQSTLKKLEETSLKDPLTGLYNRCGFKELAGREMSRAQEHNYKLGFLYLDMDNFKAINDGYGHWMGDEVLKEFANILSSAVQNNGFAARFGGDEFIVLRSGEDSMREVKSRIDEGLKCSSLMQSLAPVTVGYSMGEVIWAPGDTRNLESLISDADAKMYVQKEEKRALKGSTGSGR